MKNKNNKKIVIRKIIIKIMKKWMFVITIYLPKFQQKSDTGDRFVFSVFESVGNHFCWIFFSIVGLIMLSKSAKMLNECAYTNQSKIQIFLEFSKLFFCVTYHPNKSQKNFELFLTSYL